MIQIVQKNFIRFLKDKNLYSTYKESLVIFLKSRRIESAKDFFNFAALDDPRNLLRPLFYSKYDYLHRFILDILWCYKLLNIPYYSCKMDYKLKHQMISRIRYNMKILNEKEVLKIITEDEYLKLLYF